MLLLIRRSKKPRFVRTRAVGFSDVLFQIVKLLYDHAVSTAAGLILVFLGIVTYSLFESKESLLVTLWDFGNLIASILLLVMALFKMFVMSSRKSGPKKSE